MNFEPIKQYFKEPKFIEVEETIGKKKRKTKKQKKKQKIDFNKLSPYEITKYMYKNTRGINTPNSYILVLDSRVIGTSERADNFVYNKVVFELCEPIIIDSPTDIYLEFLQFQNTDVSQEDGTEITPHLELTSQFYLDIEEFSIKNISNNQFQSAKFFIPNDVYGKTDNFKNDSIGYTKTGYIPLKSNYLCRIEANYIKNLTLSIRAESGNGNSGSNETTLGYLSNNTGVTFITNQDELEAWATDSNNLGVLQQSISATTTLVGGWPITLNDNKILDGNGNTIQIGDRSINSGLFAIKQNNQTVTFQNLRIDTDQMVGVAKLKSVLIDIKIYNDLTITINNCGCIGNYNINQAAGTFIGKLGTNERCNIKITNCFSTGNMIGSNAGGIVGARMCNGGSIVKINNCFSTGNISGNGAGGIAGGRFGQDNNIEGNAIITNCYSTGDISDDNSGGIIGKLSGNITGSTDNAYIFIGNCYSYGTITNGAGIVGGNTRGQNLTIENCHAKGASGVGIANTELIRSEELGHEGATIQNCSAGSWDPPTISTPAGATSLGTILKNDYIDPYGTFVGRDIWITSGGSFATGYGLSSFTQIPWDSSTYTAKDSEVEFISNSNYISNGPGSIKIGLYFKKVNETQENKQKYKNIR